MTFHHKTLCDQSGNTFHLIMDECENFVGFIKVRSVRRFHLFAGFWKEPEFTGFVANNDVMDYVSFAVINCAGVSCSVFAWDMGGEIVNLWGQFGSESLRDMSDAWRKTVERNEGFIES